jgi:hypothetical protein
MGISDSQVGGGTISDALADNYAVYYIDATLGDDANDGMSTATSWKTIGKINGESFTAGSQILFKRGETWTLTLSTDRLVLSSGVMYADYGTGDMPIIDGDGVSDCLLGSDKSDITIKNLDLRNGYDACAQFIGCTNILVRDCNMQGAGNDNLIFITNNTNVFVIGGIYHDPVRRVAGPQISNIELADGGSNFIINGVELYGAENAGITIHNHDTPTEIPTNVTITNVNSHNNTGYGLQVLAQGNSTAPVISISNSIFTDNLDGIKVYKSAGTYYPQGVTISDCIFDENTNSNIFMQGYDCTIKRCILTGIATDYLILVNSAKRVNIYNNTLWLSPAAAYWPIYILGGAGIDTINIKNNIIFVNTTSGQVIGTAALSGTNVDIDYNYYYFKTYTTQARWMWLGVAKKYDVWQTDSGMDAHSNVNPATDVLFVNAPIDLTLQSSSPAIDAGVEITGITEGYLGTAPDCGAYEKA